MYRIRYLLLLLFLVTANLSVGQTEVLIIGNSLMYFNNMPNTLQVMLESTNDSVNVDCVALSGYALWDHLNRYNLAKGGSIDFVKLKRYKSQGISEEKLRKIYKYNCSLDTINKSSLQLQLEKKRYDYIFIQEHGNNLTSDLFLKYIAMKSLKRLTKILELTNHTEAKLVYFTEYPDKNCYDKEAKVGKIALRSPYDTITCETIYGSDTSYLSKNKMFLVDTIDYLSNSLAQIERYNNNLLKLKQITNFEIAPVAILFDLVKKKNPDWKMYKPAGHPSKLTSFLIASIYYRMIVGKDITISTSKFNINSKKAAEIFNEVNSYFNSNTK